MRDLLLRNAPLRNLWLGQTISYMGDSIYNIALMWFVFVETGSSVLVGLIFVAGFLPEVLFGMLLGAIVDRFNRKLLMQLSDLFRALLLGALALLFAFDWFAIWQLYVITIGLSLSNLLFGMARGAMLPDLVGSDHLIQANSLFSSSRQVTRLLGSAVGGVLVAWMGATGSITINAVTFLISLVFIQLIPNLKLFDAPAEASARKSIFADVGEGFRWILNFRVLLLLIVIGTLSNIALGPTNVLPAMYIKEDLQQNAEALGIFDAAIAIGLLAGGLFVGAVAPKRIGLWFTAGLATEGVGMLLVSIAPNLLVACIGNVVLGLGVMVSSIPLGTMIQTMTPSGMRGRVNSLSSLGFSMAIPITYGGVGWLAEVIGAKASYAAGGGLLFLCVLLGIVAMRGKHVDLNHLSTKQVAQ
ncbi:MFS transporter [Tumebacillus lipolyticus]|uniref:MFS transporter n=1 Tax=Tumebacillus lipolyticus TaxID=1280370 RepID=A0ABW4ZV54_9BACL